MQKTEIFESLFENPTPKSAYFMGFFWGDGYFNNKYNGLGMEIVKNDYDCLELIFSSVGNWSTYYRSRENRQDQATIFASSKFLQTLFTKLNYKNKSNGSHRLAIEYIPENLQHYWLRGYFDADGCIYINKKNHTRQFTWCSKYEQDWDFLVSFLARHNISANIIRRIQKSSQHSVIRGVGWQNCLYLYKFLYPNYIYDNIGLKRKYDKLSLLISDKSNRLNLDI